MRKFLYLVSREYNSNILQDYLRDVYGYSTAIIKKIKRDKTAIKRNGKHIRFVDRIYTDDLIEIILKDTTMVEANHALKAEILYDDQDVIVYDKPVGMPVHPSKSHQGDTLANAYASYCNRNNFIGTFRPIYRLDTDTTGICVIAKNQLAAVNLSFGIEKNILQFLREKFLQKKVRYQSQL